MADYKKTLNLPRTSFPMRANLTQNEPKMLAFWEKNNAYQTMVAANREEERFVLHDGPPYANGHIHLGTAMNKVLKDFIVKSRNLSGRRAEYVPGWDCHGLPIEHKVSQELKDKGKTDLPLVTVRRICRDYAAKFLDIQRKEFKRLGVFGTWDTPYRTMDPSYEAATARELGRFMAQGSVVRGKKPIHWCCSCETALAEAEVEYSDHTSPSIYVRFPLNDPRLKEVFARAEPGKAWVVIWTTTPWTLPGNMAVAVHPEFTYQLVQARGEHYVLARDLVAQCAAVFDWEDYEVLGEASGRELEGLTARHPFIDRASPIVLAPYVTLEAGTGCVHTAPGHGREDYETGLKYGLDILSPLDDQGRFLENVARFAGLNVFEANARVIQVLQDEGHLLAGQRLTHSYPHCWRCKQPVIFRATTQWFISMEKNGLRTKALAAIRDQVEWIPAWGRERIHSMIENRPDWCISRQRTWGVPIIALLCQGCDHAYTDSKWVFEIVERFQDHPRGCDYWFEAEVSELAPPGLACPECGGTSWKKEDDILDVWFDSGTSFAAVVEQRPECSFPADLYLEGTDQHRGWFHSSLLASVGTRERAPYRSVLTHGYVVDGEGRKMSKSLGNVIAPQEIIETHGAEILRLWVSAVNYQEDVRISDEILGRLVDAYRRIRNTCRFLLGNIDGFGPGDVTPFAGMQPLDRYLLHRVARAHKRMAGAYREYQFHRVFHTLHELCVTDLSAFYLDIVKDRLYVSGPGSPERRSAQTALWWTLATLVHDMAPVLSFTAEEVFQHIPQPLRGTVPTVFAFKPGELPPDLITREELELWDLVWVVRGEVTKAIEPLRRDGSIGHSLNAHVLLHADEELREALAGVVGDLRDVFIVSRVSLEPRETAPKGSFQSEELPGLRISVVPAQGAKCERCWVFSQELGTNPAHPSVCPRCSDVLATLPGEEEKA